MKHFMAFPDSMNWQWQYMKFKQYRKLFVKIRKAFVAHRTLLSESIPVVFPFKFWKTLDFTSV